MPPISSRVPFQMPASGPGLGLWRKQSDYCIQDALRTQRIKEDMVGLIRLRELMRPILDRQAAKP